MVEKGEGVCFVSDDGVVASLRLLVQKSKFVQGVRIFGICSFGGTFEPPDGLSRILWLAEEWFSTTQNTTQVITGTTQQISVQSKFLPVSNPLAVALGAKPLTPETSLNYSLGLTYEPIRRLRLLTRYRDQLQADMTGSGR